MKRLTLLSSILFCFAAAAFAQIPSDAFSGKWKLVKSSGRRLVKQQAISVSFKEAAESTVVDERM